MVTKEREKRFEFPPELLSSVLTAAGWDESEHPRHPEGTSRGGKFAPKGEELFDPGTPEKVNDLQAEVYKMGEAWADWTTRAFDYAHETYGGVAARGGDPEAVAAKVWVQDKIAGKLKGDADFKSLIQVLDPFGDWKSEFEPGGQMETATTVEQQVAALSVKNWSLSSGDHDTIAVQFQIAAEQEFGLEPNRFAHEAWSEIVEADGTYDPNVEVGVIPDGHNKQFMDAQQFAGARKFLRAQYDLTQEMLAEKGITHVYAYRGMGWDSPEKIPANIQALRDQATSQYEADLEAYEQDPQGAPPRRRDYGGMGIVDTHGNALSSWSNNSYTAETFSAGGYYHAIAGTKIDVRRIVSTAFTGFGCLNESEYVVLGDKDMDSFVWVWGADEWGASDFDHQWVKASNERKP